MSGRHGWTRAIRFAKDVHVWYQRRNGRLARTEKGFAMVRTLGAVVMACLVLVLVPGIASAASSTYGDCMIHAYDPTFSTSGTIKASGDVICNNYHVLGLTVRLQFYDHGSWNTSVKSPVSCRRCGSLSTTATGYCNVHYDFYWRTKSYVNIDNASVGVVSASQQDPY